MNNEKVIWADELKTRLVTDRRTANITCGVMHTIFDIIDEMEDAFASNKKDEQ